MKKPHLPRSLKFKVGFHLAIALTLAVTLFTFLIVRHHRDQLLEGVVDHVRQLSEVVTKSTRFAMLQNQRPTVYRIIKNIGAQERIEKVRILSKEGLIIHSTYMPEVATEVDRNAEACYLCHEGDTAAPESTTGKSWIFAAPEGERFLGHVEVIRNEPSCYTNVLCHAHPEDQTVLGVLEITYSLAGIDEKIRKNTFTIAGFSFGFVIVASFFVTFFVHRMVYIPLRDLEKGSKRLSSGNLDQLIPVRSRDEFGHLASSFNAMTLALRSTELELQEWNRTLEEKVDEKTRELQIAEAMTVQAEKMASVGLLAAGVAHELNNPLTGVLTFTNLLRKKMTDGTQDAEDLDLVIRETRRCSSIIRRLLDFAREKRPEKKFVDINDIVPETEKIVRHPVTTREIEIQLELDKGLPQLWVDPDQIKQVFMNILVNARDSIGRNGTITIRSRRLPKPRPPVHGEEPVSMVEVSFSDTGGGIESRHQQKIFDPFFTTKGVGKGTGLGLSVTYGIVRAHGGTIEVESAAGEGAVFKILLPLETQMAEVAGGQNEQKNPGS
jgi:two-component system NtrC family sensor kinase